jgi:FkbM family methyltransferase
MTVADVGANVGYYSWLAASMVGPSGRVLAFEPGPYAFDRLQRVIRENGVRGVETLNIALGDRSCRGTLFVPHHAVGNYNPSLTPYLSDMERVEVSIERLDTVLRNLAVHRIDLMKVDVEGHELGVFVGPNKQSPRSGSARFWLSSTKATRKARAGVALSSNAGSPRIGSLSRRLFPPSGARGSTTAFTSNRDRVIRGA